MGATEFHLCAAAVSFIFTEANDAKIGTTFKASWKLFPSPSVDSLAIHCRESTLGESLACETHFFCNYTNHV